MQYSGDLGGTKFETLKILHFLGFILGFGGGIGNMVSGIKLSNLPPDSAPAVGQFQFTMGRISTFGIILLWLTGIAMVVLSYGWSVFSSQLFVYKFSAVVLMTIFSIAANVTVEKARKAKMPPDERRMKMLGMGIGVAAFIALTLAVFNFS